jgi:hypothetical protein
MRIEYQIKTQQKFFVVLEVVDSYHLEYITSIKLLLQSLTRLVNDFPKVICLGDFLMWLPVHPTTR